MFWRLELWYQKTNRNDESDWIGLDWIELDWILLRKQSVATSKMRNTLFPSESWFDWNNIMLFESWSVYTRMKIDCNKGMKMEYPKWYYCFIQ